MIQFCLESLFASTNSRSYLIFERIINFPPKNPGKTIADIYTESEELKDQVVSLNARVIRFKSKLMGKNWITLQDGTGSKPDNKIVATTQEVLKPGDLVTVKGTLATNVDLGRGYSYKVMLEEATFSPGLE